jgi:hypothetical protein
MDKEFVIQELRRQGIQIHPVHNMIVLPTKKNIGMGAWSYIDYLKNTFNFSVTTKNKKGKTNNGKSYKN